MDKIREKELQLLEAMKPFISAGTLMIKYGSEKPPIINISSYITVATLFAELEALKSTN